MKQTKLYHVTVDDFGETKAIGERLSNVVIIGFDTSGVLTFINYLDEEALDYNQKTGVYEACEEIVNLLGLRAVKCVEPETTSVKYNSPYEATVEGMLSADYKERFKAEYAQLKIRVDKLNTFCNRIEASRAAAIYGKLVEEPKHDCSFELLTHQLHVMREYLHDLEIRAIIEGIDLT